MSLFDLLKADHDAVKDLMTAILGQEDLQRRQDLCATLAHQMRLHNQAEAKVVYEALKAVEDKQDLVAGSLEEHTEAESLLERLLGQEMSEEDWTATFNTAQEGILQHISREETETFEALQDTFEDDELDAFAKSFEAEKAALAEA
jgi:hemerythrin superfamily protein